jgi:hypothetical protein
MTIPAIAGLASGRISPEPTLSGPKRAGSFGWNADSPQTPWALMGWASSQKPESFPSTEGSVAA